jgi:hypothetical protein
MSFRAEREEAQGKRRGRGRERRRRRQEVHGDKGEEENQLDGIEVYQDVRRADYGEESSL